MSVLGGAAALIAAAWLVAAGGDGAWVSAPLLVLFPILIQLGFVFIGAQAGRLLDISGIKRELPADHGGVPGRRGGRGTARRVAGLRDRPDARTLLLATAVAQATFAVLVLATERRHPAELAGSGRGGTTIERHGAADDAAAGTSIRRLLRSRFVAADPGLPGPLRPRQPARRLPRPRPGDRPIPRDRPISPASWPATPRS